MRKGLKGSEPQVLDGLVNYYFQKINCVAKLGNFVEDMKKRKGMEDRR